jgi:hypothetical protein
MLGNVAGPMRCGNQLLFPVKYAVCCCVYLNSRWRVGSNWESLIQLAYGRPWLGRNEIVKQDYAIIVWLWLLWYMSSSLPGNDNSFRELYIQSCSFIMSLSPNIRRSIVSCLELYSLVCCMPSLSPGRDTDSLLEPHRFVLIHPLRHQVGTSIVN